MTPSNSAREGYLESRSGQEEETVMHGINPGELIWVIIFTIVLASFWRALLILLICATLAMILLGLVTTVSFFGH